MSFEDFLKKQRENIARTGRNVVGVFPSTDSKDPLNDAFAYSIGNGLKNLPELLVVGLWDDTFIINALSMKMIERGRAFDDREVVSLGTPCPVCVVEASENAKSRYTLQATEFHGGAENYRLMQVVLSDPKGLFPWQSGCAKPYRDIVILRANSLN